MLKCINRLAQRDIEAMIDHVVGNKFIPADIRQDIIERTDANDIIKASCPTAVPLTPVARLDTAEARLEAVIHAVDLVRRPLEAFYNSLSDEHKQRFENMGSRGRGQAPILGLFRCSWPRDVRSLSSSASILIARAPLRSWRTARPPLSLQN